MKVIAWWSAGVTSAVATKLAIDEYGIDNVVEILTYTVDFCAFEFATGTFLLAFNLGGIVGKKPKFERMIRNRISYISIHYLISF